MRLGKSSNYSTEEIKKEYYATFLRLGKSSNYSTGEQKWLIQKVFLRLGKSSNYSTCEETLCARISSWGLVNLLIILLKCDNPFWYNVLEAW